MSALFQSFAIKQAMKKIFYFYVGLSGIALAALALAFSMPGDVKKKHRIVIQMTTPDTAAYRALTRQLNNVLTEWPEAQIDVVAHNKGLGLLEKKKSNVSAELAALTARGVQFYACEQTMKQLKITREDVLPLAGFVPRGIVHIVQRQEEDWAYIKGGF